VAYHGDFLPGLVSEDSYQGIVSRQAVGTLIPITRFGALNQKDRLPWKSGVFSGA
jgi:hypothetical protein